MKFIFSFFVLIVVPSFAVQLNHLTRRSEHDHDRVS